MKRTGLTIAIAVVIVSNVFVLIGVRRNRAGGPIETIELTERELALQTLPQDNSGVTLQIRWLPNHFGPGRDMPIDSAKLQELGFDCSIQPNAVVVERWLLPKEVYAAFEYGGAAWARQTRLFWVDAARNADELLRRYPDRQKYLIVRAVIVASPYPDQDQAGKATKPRSWRGWVSEIIPSEIYVPPSFAKLLSGLDRKVGAEPRYTVTLQYGRNLEPWITNVKLLGEK